MSTGHHGVRRTIKRVCGFFSARSGNERDRFDLGRNYSDAVGTITYGITRFVRMKPDTRSRNVEPRPNRVNNSLPRTYRARARNAQINKPYECIYTIIPNYSLSNGILSSTLAHATVVVRIGDQTENGYHAMTFPTSDDVRGSAEYCRMSRPGEIRFGNDGFYITVRPETDYVRGPFKKFPNYRS